MAWAARSWLWVLAAATLGCYSSRPAPPPDPAADCVDLDGDGYGQGDDCLAADCDDTDGTRNLSCASACDDDPGAPGCLCDPALSQPIICYQGPAGTEGFGACEAGLSVCRGGRWSSCEQQVLPGVEACNGVDDDCDGAVDDGVLSACGDCTLDCRQDCVGLGCGSAFVAGAGTEVAPDGSLVLSRGGADLMPRQIWISSANDGTVTRVDTTTFEVRSRHRTGPQGAGEYPVAVAVGRLGDAYVVNSYQGQSGTTLTRILSSGCEDQDGDGVVETSSSFDVLDWGRDECVAWSIPVEECLQAWGCGTGWGIALTEDGAKVWVSLSQRRSVVELDAESGQLTGRELGLAGSVTGMVADGAGNLWVSAYGDVLYRIELDAIDDYESLNLPGASWATNVDMDDEGRIVVASPLSFYDPLHDTFDATVWTAFDVAVTADGMAWGTDGTRTLRRYDPASLDYDSFTVQDTPSQLAADLDGRLWAVDQFGGTVSIYDAEGELLDTILDDCDGQFGGNGCLEYAYLEGDPSGVRFQRSFGLGGQTQHVFDVECPGGTWRELGWETSGGGVTLLARSADRVEELPSHEWVRIGSTPPDSSAASLGTAFAAQAAPLSRFLEVRAQLNGSPARLARIDVSWSCDAP